MVKILFQGIEHI